MCSPNLEKYKLVEDIYRCFPSKDVVVTLSTDCQSLSCFLLSTGSFKVPPPPHTPTHFHICALEDSGDFPQPSVHMLGEHQEILHISQARGYLRCGREARGGGACCRWRRVRSRTCSLHHTGSKRPCCLQPVRIGSSCDNCSAAAAEVLQEAPAGRSQRD